jgi:hypothetical protein
MYYTGSNAPAGQPGAHLPRFTINKDGFVGIGTTQPSSIFTARGTNAGEPCGPALISWGGPVSYGCTNALALTTDNVGINLLTGANHISGNVFSVRGNGGVYAAGNVGIGTPLPTARLSVNGTANKPGGGSWDNFSDVRLKTLKGEFTPGLKAVMELQPLRYEYNSDNPLGIKSEGEHVGFSAQAVQQVIPEAVRENDNGYLLVNNDPILWTMLNAIKEQQSQIEELKRLACLDHPEAAVCK